MMILNELLIFSGWLDHKLVGKSPVIEGVNEKILCEIPYSNLHL